MIREEIIGDARLFDLPAKRRGTGGHHSALSETTVWLTPPALLSALDPFDLDPCAVPQPRPWPTATRMISPPQNGLTVPWEGRVWLNPPYGGPAVVAPWMRRMADHNHGTALIFARTETAVFHRYVWERAAALLFLEGRISFHRPSGAVGRTNSGAPSVLVAYGDDDARTLRESGIKGAFIRIRDNVSFRDAEVS